MCGCAAGIGCVGLWVCWLLHGKTGSEANIYFQLNRRLCGHGDSGHYADTRPDLSAKYVRIRSTCKARIAKLCGEHVDPLQLHLRQRACEILLE